MDYMSTEMTVSAVWFRPDVERLGGYDSLGATIGVVSIVLRPGSFHFHAEAALM